MNHSAPENVSEFSAMLYKIAGTTYSFRGNLINFLTFSLRVQPQLMKGLILGM
jgi:hypothetical protein